MFKKIKDFGKCAYRRWCGTKHACLLGPFVIIIYITIYYIYICLYAHTIS